MPRRYPHRRPVKTTYPPNDRRYLMSDAIGDDRVALTEVRPIKPNSSTRALQQLAEVTVRPMTDADHDAHHERELWCIANGWPVMFASLPNWVDAQRSEQEGNPA